MVTPSGEVMKTSPEVEITAEFDSSVLSSKVNEESSTTSDEASYSMIYSSASSSASYEVIVVSSLLMLEIDEFSSATSSVSS